MRIRVTALAQRIRRYRRDGAAIKVESVFESRNGTAAIEFGLSIPVLFLLLVGVVEIGYSMYQAMQVNNAAEAGMMHVLKNGFDPADVSGVTAAVANATGTPNITATPAPTQFYGCAESSGVVETTEDSTCTDGNTPSPYVRVNAELPRVTILPYPAFGLPDTLRARSIIRLN